MKAIVLARVSSREQAEGESIEAPTRNLLEYTQINAFEISKAYKIVESSTKDTRKQFDSIITSIKKAVTICKKNTYCRPERIKATELKSMWSVLALSASLRDSRQATS